MSNSLGCALLTGLAYWATGSLAFADPQIVLSQRVIDVPRAAPNVDAPVLSTLAISPDRKLVAGAGDDHLVRLWDYKTGALVETLQGHRDWVRAIKFSPDGKTLATAGDDRQVILWDVASRTRRVALRESIDAIYALAYQSDGQLLATCGFENIVRLYSANGEPVAQLEAPTADMREIEFSPRGDMLVAAGRGGYIRAWNLADRTERWTVQSDERRVRSLAFSPDGTQLATGGEGRSIRLWNAQGQALATLPVQPGRIYSLVFCTDSLLASGGTDNVVRLHELSSQAEVMRLVGHKGSVTSMVYDPVDGQLVSGGFDTTIRFWATREGAPDVARVPARSGR